MCPDKLAESYQGTCKAPNKKNHYGRFLLKMLILMKIHFKALFININLLLKYVCYKIMVLYIVIIFKLLPFE